MNCIGIKFARTVVGVCGLNCGWKEKRKNGQMTIKIKESTAHVPWRIVGVWACPAWAAGASSSVPAPSPRHVLVWVGTLRRDHWRGGAPNATRKQGS